MTLGANRFAAFSNISMATIPVRWVRRNYPVTLQAVLFSVTSGAVWLLTARIFCVLEVPSSRMIINR